MLGIPMFNGGLVCVLVKFIILFKIKSDEARISYF